ncbi:universal stress protein [Streptosporangium sp. NPDC051022]|uniref:universal stress protein n=1 Tax=Streptosporangium sp. NPDC051022 TaxID=3155752 RepID=UPI00342584CD
MRREIVVAFDGSPHSRTAVEWAAGECRARRVELTVCHVWDGPRAGRGTTVPAGERGLAGHTLIDGVQLAERLLPGRAVRAILLRGTPGPELASVSRAAEMLVVGGRGTGGIAGSLLGSVSAHVTAHALCPVLAVPRRPDPAVRDRLGEVVVGVDGSASSLAALRFALGHARIHRLAVHVVHAKADASFRRTAEVERWITETVNRLPRSRPGTVVTVSALDGPPLPALLPYGERARLMVVGSRGPARLGERVPGSVSQEVLHRAGCPVAVVKDRAGDRPPPTYIERDNSGGGGGGEPDAVPACAGSQGGGDDDAVRYGGAQ